MIVWQTSFLDGLDSTMQVKIYLTYAKKLNPNRLNRRSAVHTVMLPL